MLTLSSTTRILWRSPEFRRSGIVLSMFWFYGGDFPHLYISRVKSLSVVSDFEL